MLDQLLKGITRRKPVDDDTVEESALARVLTVFDLTALGVGATLGAGVYVLTGAVAKDITGPSVVISFLIAALTSVLSGLCYAEFGARVPKAGSGYVYSYVTVGELCAFVIGWNLVLSYVIGAASVARAWTGNFDALIGNHIENYMKECCSMNLPGLAPYPDIFSFLIVMILAALIAFGVREFATINKIFTVLNICVILFVIIVGLTQADMMNWSLTPELIREILANRSSTSTVTSLISNSTFSDFSTTASYVGAEMTTAVNDSVIKTAVSAVTELAQISGATAAMATDAADEYGVGGFLPYGISGMISGTATCFYAFVGFDCIATTGEEAINPQRSIPLGIVLSLAVCCVAYLGISATLTLMQPYFLLDELAPLPHAFEEVGLVWATYPVSVGAICALSTSLLGAMFPMPRIIYAMATDGLLFRFLAHVHPKTKTPLIATMISGAFAGIMAVFFDLKELVDLMSIGTLAAYTLVAVSVLLLRYQPDPVADKIAVSDEKAELDAYESDYVSSSFELVTLFKPASSRPTHRSSNLVAYTSCIVTLGMILFSVVAVLSSVGWNPALIVFLVLFGLVIIVGTVVIWCQPQSNKELSFAVPAVPLIPILNMFVNIYLMVSLPPSTWYKMLIWMTVGFLIYFLYGIRNSEEANSKRVVEMKDMKSDLVEEKELLRENRGDYLATE